MNRIYYLVVFDEDDNVIITADFVSIRDFYAIIDDFLNHRYVDSYSLVDEFVCCDKGFLAVSLKRINV